MLEDNEQMGTEWIISETKLHPNRVTSKVGRQIIDSRKPQASRQFDSSCLRAGFGRNLVACADGKYLGSFDRKCFRVGMRRAAGEHATVHQDRVWRGRARLYLSSRGRCRQRDYEDQHGTAV